MTLPRLYAILDADILHARSIPLEQFTSELLAAGVTLVQYRDKSGSARRILKNAASLRAIFSANPNIRLLLNDRADLALLAGFDGIHVGQEDLHPEEVRGIVGHGAWVGVSTHSAEQLTEADATSCDYIAYGPVFSTATKNNPDPTVGLEGLQRVRALTGKPIVAIGGITLQNCRSALDAGADSVAVISGLLPSIDNPVAQGTQRIAEEFLRSLT